MSLVIEESELFELSERLRAANRDLRKLYSERRELLRRIDELEALISPETTRAGQ
jgi:hypothetical protein